MITDFGAVGDRKTLNTDAIQKAIDAAAGQGGVVVIPSGVILSGSLFLKQGWVEPFISSVQLNTSGASSSFG